MASQLHSEIFDPAAAGVLTGVHDMRVGNETRVERLSAHGKDNGKEETDPAYGSRLFAGIAAWIPVCIFPDECLVGWTVLPVGAALRDGGCVGLRVASSGCRELAAHRRHDESQYFLLTGRVPELHPGGDVLAGERLSRSAFSVPQGVLQLAVSGGDGF